jgi:uncharacterized membrane protein YhaH (DUF805 family)
MMSMTSMSFRASVKTCFNKYAVFQGRASRSEFWWFQLFYATAYSQGRRWIPATAHDAGGGPSRLAWPRSLSLLFSLHWVSHQ